MSWKPVSADHIVLRDLISQSPEMKNSKASGREFKNLLSDALASSEHLSAPQVAEALKIQMMRGAATLGSLDSGFSASTDDSMLKALLSRAYSSQERGATLAPPCSLQSASEGDFPTDGLDGIIQRASRRFHVAPALVKAVIKAESAFDPNAVSPAGAQGLMQLMPGTAKEVGVENPFDPEKNVMGGVKYLRMMLDRFDGDLDTALAAYNWGPGNVERRGEDLPKETRNYQVRVKEYLKEFSAG